MNRLNKFLAATFLSAAMFVTTAAQAMQVQVYERMSVNDQADYTGVLIKGAEQVLTDEGRPDQAAQVEKLFTTIEPGDEHSLGMVELELNLAAVSKADADNLVKNPNAKPLQVELAMIATLKQNGIILPRSFMHVGDSFQPKDPKAHRLEVEDAMLVTLQKNNIPLSQTFVQAFRAINKDFQPKLPPQKK